MNSIILFWTGLGLIYLSALISILFILNELIPDEDPIQEDIDNILNLTDETTEEY